MGYKDDIYAASKYVFWDPVVKLWNQSIMNMKFTMGGVAGGVCVCLCVPCGQIPFEHAFLQLKYQFHKRYISWGLLLFINASIITWYGYERESNI